MQLNFLEICLSPDLGGLELSVLDFHSFFSKRASCKIVVAPESKLAQRYSADDRFLLSRNKFFPLIPAKKLANYIDKYDIDIIHFHWTRDIALVVLAKLLSRKKPKILQSRHMNMTRFKDDFYHKWLYKNIDTIHAVTDGVKRQLEEYIPQEVRPFLRRVYLGVQKQDVDTKQLRFLHEKYELGNSFVVGIIGRIEEAKGQYLLIEALANLRDLDIKVLIIGSAMDEKYLSKLKRQAKKLGVLKRVVFTGFIDTIAPHIALCDTTVLATKNETFGLVVIESMCSGTPVIATKIGGPLEIILDMQDGLFFDASPHDLAVKIELLYRDSAFKERLAQEATKKVEKEFNQELQMQKMYEVMCES